MMRDASATRATESHVGSDHEGGRSDAEDSLRRQRFSGASRSTGISRGSSRRSGNSAADLDKLIDRGDWSGVVAAASRYSGANASSSNQKSGGSESKTGKKGGRKKLRQPAGAIDSTGDAGSQGSERSCSAGSKGWRSRLGGWGSSKRGGATRFFRFAPPGGAGASSSSRRTPGSREEQEALEQAEIWMTIAEQSKQKTGGGEPKGASDSADWATQRSLSALRHAEADGSLGSGQVGSGNAGGGARGKKARSAGSLGDESL